MLFEIVLGFDEMQRARDNVKDGRKHHADPLRNGQNFPLGHG
jgi:hypothetical protein